MTTALKMTCPVLAMTCLVSVCGCGAYGFAIQVSGCPSNDAELGVGDTFELEISITEQNAENRPGDIAYLTTVQGGATVSNEDTETPTVTIESIDDLILVNVSVDVGPSRETASCAYVP